MKFLFLFYCIPLLVLFSDVYADPAPVSLTNNAGRTIKVSLKKATESEVTVQLRSNRKVHTLQISDLDNASRAKIKKWLDEGGGSSTDFEISYTSGKSSRTSKREQYDDKTLKLRPTVSVKNRDSSASAKNLKVTLLLVGSPVNETSLYYVFTKQTKKTGLIEAGESFVAEYSSLVTEYDDKGYSKFGAKYHGYVIIVQNARGSVVASKSIPSTLITKHGKKFLELKAKQCYTRQLEEEDFNIQSYRN